MRRPIPTTIQYFGPLRLLQNLSVSLGKMCPEAAATNHDYLEEARNIRARAREVHDAEARAQLLLIASLYDKLAYLTDILVPSLHAKLSENSHLRGSAGS